MLSDIDRSCRCARWIALLVAVALTGGCSLLVRDLEKPGVQLVSIAPQQVGLSGIKLLCRLQIDNPNDVDIPISGGEFYLEIENLQIATGELPARFSVPALDNEVVDVVVDVNTGNSFALFLNLLGGSPDELEYALTGHIDVALALLGRVRLEERGTVPLRGRAYGGAQQSI